MSRTCIDCPAPVSVGSKTGRCRPCFLRFFNSDPDIRRKRAAAISAAHAKPETRAKISASMRRFIAANPEAIEVRRRNARDNVHKTLRSPKSQAILASAECRARSSATLSRVKLERAGIPLEWRETYLKLIRSGKMKAVDARAEVHRRIAQAEAARLAALTPFERQLERVRNGARIIEKPRIPTRSYNFSLIGGSL